VAVCVSACCLAPCLPCILVWRIRVCVGAYWRATRVGFRAHMGRLQSPYTGISGFEWSPSSSIGPHWLHANLLEEHAWDCGPQNLHAQMLAEPGDDETKLAWARRRVGEGLNAVGLQLWDTCRTGVVQEGTPSSLEWQPSLPLLNGSDIFSLSQGLLQSTTDAELNINTVVPCMLASKGGLLSGPGYVRGSWFGRWPDPGPPTLTGKGKVSKATMHCTMDAHRLVAWAVHGPGPNNTSVVMHACEGCKTCVSPAHLSWGSQEANCAPNLRRALTVREASRQANGLHLNCIPLADLGIVF
jgi:hypothetical protein